jgi:hypothetical protein
MNNQANSIVAFTHQRCGSPLSQLGEGFWASVATDAGALVFAGQQQPATLSEFFLLHAGVGGFWAG